MGWPKEHKMNTRKKILVAAAKLFPRFGYEGISIDRIMSEAGLTRGSFYSHFSTKSNLYIQALRYGAEQGLRRLEDIGDEDKNHIELYLSEEHLKGESVICPLAALVSDVVQRDECIRDAYTQLLQGFTQHVIYRKAVDTHSISKKRVLQQAVVMIGGMAIARTITDENLASKILEYCQDLVKNELST